MTERLGPVTPRERVHLLDVLRGFAILGIPFVNYDVAGYLNPLVLPSALDRLGHWLIFAFGAGKLWPLFAILFGVGFAIQLERAEARGRNIVPTYLRRLLFLALIGGALQLVIQVSQLILLARAGFLMLLVGYVLRRRPASWVLAGAMIALALNIAAWTLRDFSRDPGLQGAPEVPQEEVAAQVESLREEIWSRTQSEGFWNLDALARRVPETLRWYWTGLPVSFLRFWTYANYVGYMLLGIFLWRIGVLQRAPAHRRFFLRLLSVCLPIGLGAAVFANHVSQEWFLTNYGQGAYPGIVTRIFRFPLQTIASLAMPLAYTAAIALLMQNRRWAGALMTLAPVGRMALSNYALQAILPALLFGAYIPGISRMVLGVWGTVAVLALVAVLQVIFSQAWLRSYRFGPLEWVWRSLTYWRLQPMRAERTG